MKRLLTAAGCALVLAAPAAASVDIAPKRIDPGETARLVFWVTNEGKVPITGVAIGMPADFSLGEAETKAIWKTAVHARTATWEGYRIMPGQFASFAVTVKAPKMEERAVFTVLASMANGSTATWQTTTNVVPAQPTRDTNARLIATIALIVAGVAVVLALAGGILALWLWLRPRPELY